MADTTYNYSISSDTLNGLVTNDHLEQEIINSAIVIALKEVDTLGDNLDIVFKSALTAGDKTVLDAIVANHDGSFLPDNEASIVKILEEDSDPNKRTGGHYQAVGLRISVPASTGIHTKDFTFPHPISLMSMEYVPKSSMDGDKFDILVAPETTIGSITADVTASDTIINVDATVLASTFVGAVIHIDDGTNKDLLGKVLSVDKAGGTITVESGATNAFLAATPTYVKQTVRLVENVWIHGTVLTELGSTKIGGSYLPANTVIRIEYDNVTGTAKDYDSICEILY